MKPITKLVWLAAACGLLLVTFSVIGPRVVRAAVATLVQVTNTSATPAVVQDVSKLAGQAIELNCNQTCVQILPDGTFIGTYTVPAGQHLVISTVVLTLGSGGIIQLSQTADNVITSGHASWTLTSGGTYEYQYPTGIIIPQNTTLAVTGIALANSFVYGYLSAN